MAGHGAKFGRKKEEAIAALLVHRNTEEAARAVGIAPKTLLRWLQVRSSKPLSGLQSGPCTRKRLGGSTRCPLRRFRRWEK
jgi:transposase-like protein